MKEGQTDIRIKQGSRAGAGRVRLQEEGASIQILIFRRKEWHIL